MVRWRPGLVEHRGSGHRARVVRGILDGVLIRRERPADTRDVQRVHRHAFAQPTDVTGVPPEVVLLSALRRSPDWIPHLSLVVAHVDDGIIGHVVCTRARIGRGHPGLALGPLAVLPHHQGVGVGHALMHAVLAAAEAVDETVVGVLGDPAYYARFGFRPASAVGIAPQHPSWADNFQIRILGASGAPPTGCFHYPAPFDAL